MIDSCNVLTEEERKQIGVDAFRYRTCAVCGKRKYIAYLDLYAYKRRRGSGLLKYYCGYACFRKDDTGKKYQSRK